MVTKSSLDRKAIWSKVKSIRYEYLKRNADIKSSNGFIPEADIILNIDELSKLIGVYNISNDTSGVLSKESINKGAEMFVALNLRPSNILRLYWKAIYVNRICWPCIIFKVA